VPTATSHAPGRVELLGNHTDYNEGYVLSAAINHGVTAVGATRGDDSIRLSTDGDLPAVEAGLSALRPLEGPAAWANYPLGVVAALRESGIPVGGFEARFTSDLPIGAGLSSSAALEVATAMLLRKLFPFERSPLEIAKLCRHAENHFVGVNCGLLDQVSSVFGRAGHIVFLDCRTETVETVPFPADLALLITHSGVKHALVGGEYNERRAQCFEAARVLGVPMLRDATTASLVAARDRMPDTTFRRAAHVVGENERVLGGVDLLRRSDGAAFGALMFDSHESSRTQFENSAPELDALVALAREIPGVLGSRLSGGGFGGATVSLVRRSQAGAVAATLAERYLATTGNLGRCWVCEPSDGAR
jgi:galactokinase